MESEAVLIAVAQVSPKLAELDANLQLHLKNVEYAREAGAQVVVFPELSLTGYSIKDLTADLAQQVGRSKTLKGLEEASRGISIVAGFVEEGGEGEEYIYYNSAAYFESGKLKAVHRKVYLPTYGMFDEERYFSPGNTIRAFGTKYGRCAILICEDYWHPSSVYLAAQDGAVTHLYLANAPLRGMMLQDEITSTGISEQMARISSQLYGVYTVYANRVGYEDGVAFAGCSRVISPTGDLVAVADHREEELLLAEIVPEQVRRARVFFPLMGDEKLDMVHRELTRIINKRYRSEGEEGTGD